MDRRLARKNLILGFAVAALSITIFGLTFLAAAAYLG
jgi:hypothetical protein